MNKKTSLIETHSIEDGAVLKSQGFNFTSAHLSDSGRVVLVFENNKNKGEGLLEKHSRGGLEVNSLLLLEAMRWTKDRIFECRRRNGLN